MLGHMRPPARLEPALFVLRGLRMQFFKLKYNTLLAMYPGTIQAW